MIIFLLNIYQVQGCNSTRIRTKNFGMGITIWYTYIPNERRELFHLYVFSPNNIRKEADEAIPLRMHA